MDSLQQVHDSLCSHSGLLSSTSSKLSNAMSIHYCGNPLSLSQIGRFVDEAAKSLVRTKRSYNLGVLSGELVVSVNLRPPVSAASSAPASKRKRASETDDAHDRAKAAVDQAKRILDRRAEGESKLDVAHLTYAQRILERVFRDVRGTNGEIILESLGLSIAPPSSATSSRPRVIVACRLSGGVGIPIFLLKSIFSRDGKFFDGLITTKVDTLGPEYRLPLSQLGKVAEAKGQHSALLFVGIPPPPSPVLPVLPPVLPPSADENEEERARKARRFVNAD